MRLPDGTILMHGAAPYDPVKAHEYYLKTRELKGRAKGTGLPAPKTKPVYQENVLDTQKRAAWNRFLGKLPLTKASGDVKKTEAFVKNLVGKSDFQLLAAQRDAKDDPGTKNAEAKRQTIDALMANRNKARTKMAGEAKAKTTPKKEAKPAEKKLSPKERRERKAAATRHIAGLTKTLSKLNAELKEAIVKAKASEAKSKKPDTAAEKASAARDAEKYRNKHKQELASKSKKAAASSSSTSSTQKTDSVESLQTKIATVQNSLAKAKETLQALG